MEMSIGKRIRDHLFLHRIPVQDFAGRIGMKPANAYNILRKNNLSSHLLLRISQELNHDFFQYYSIQLRQHMPGMQVQDENMAVLMQQLNEMQIEMKLLQDKVTLMQEQLEDKRQIIRLHEAHLRKMEAAQKLLRDKSEPD